MLRIRIDFSEAAEYLEMPLFSRIYDDSAFADYVAEELMHQISDDYFSGAENCLLYIGVNYDSEYFEFELIPG